MIDQLRHMVDAVLICRDRNHVEDLHHHTVELDDVPAGFDEPGMEEDGGCLPEERDLTRIMELVPPVEEGAVEKRVDRQVGQELRYGANRCAIDVGPDR